MRCFSMFTGVGGFELGIRQAIGDRGECIGFSEIDKYASQVLKKRFEGVKNYGDARKINANELPSFDLLVGGFPCQSFSIAGKRRGFDDTRGTLFFEVARVLKAKKPKNFVLENVKGLLSHEKGQTFRVIIDTLTELGYDVQWMVLNSKFFGVPQNRERVFIIGSLRGTSRPEILPFRSYDKEVDENRTVVRTLTGGGHSGGKHSQMTGIKQLNNPTHSNNRLYGVDGVSPALNTAQGGNRQPKIKAVLTPDRAEKRQMGRRFKEDGEPSFTLTGQDIHGVCITQNTITEATGNRAGSSKEYLRSVNNVAKASGQIRRLTPVECERLQGFPDSWFDGLNLSDTQRYKMMGNAITVNVVQAIMEKLLNGGLIEKYETN